MREVLSLHLGQAGVELGTTCWELYCREHRVDSAGHFLQKSEDQQDTELTKLGGMAEGFSSFFQEMPSGKYSPLALLVDLEPSVVDEVRNGSYRNLYSPGNLVTGSEDAANNYARGAYSVGKAALKSTLEPLRKMTEVCDRLQGFIISHSFAGGTGSGFNAILNEALSSEYPKRSKLETAVFPSPTMSTAVVEPYNAVLCTNATLDHTDCVFISDNEAMYKICQSCLDIDNPTYSNLNHLLALTVSSITASLRFKSSLNADFTDFQTNLVPYPKIHFPIMSYAPVVSSLNATHETMSIVDLTSQSFSPQNRLLRCENESGLYMSCCLLYRGEVVPRDVNDALAHMKEKRSVKFVSWAPTGFKVGINEQIPFTMQGSDFSPIGRAVCMLCNTTAIKDTWSNVNLKYNVMLEKKAFIHWYVMEGLEPEEFVVAMENILTLEQDYDFMNKND